MHSASHTAAQEEALSRNTANRTVNALFHRMVSLWYSVLQFDASVSFESCKATHVGLPASEQMRVQGNSKKENRHADHL